MNILSVVGVCIVGCVCAVRVKHLNNSIGILCSVVCSLVISVFIFQRVMPCIDFLKALSSEGENNEYLSVMLKGCCICFISEIGVDICRDFGEISIAQQVETAGKVEILVLSLPLVRSVIELSRELMSN